MNLKRPSKWSVLPVPSNLIVMLLRLSSPSSLKMDAYTSVNHGDLQWSVNNMTNLSRTSENLQKLEVSVKTAKGHFTTTGGSWNITLNQQKQTRALTLVKGTDHSYERMRVWRSIWTICWNGWFWTKTNLFCNLTRKSQVNRHALKGTHFVNIITILYILYSNPRWLHKLFVQ